MCTYGVCVQVHTQLILPMPCTMWPLVWISYTIITLVDVSYVSPVSLVQKKNA